MNKRYPVKRISDLSWTVETVKKTQKKTSAHAETHENTQLRSSCSEYKVKFQRVRISEERKARTVQFHERNPHKTLAECVSWAKLETY